MDAPIFTVSAVATRDEFDELVILIYSLIDLFPEDKRVLGDALYALQRGRSLIAIGRYEDDPLAFYVVSLDGKPELEAIYVPPEIRDSRLGSSLFVFMAAALHSEKIPLVRIRANPKSLPFFERLGARVIPGASPVPHEWTLMEFAPDDLKRPPGWFEHRLAVRQKDVN